jgi:hypothetical protein
MTSASLKHGTMTDSRGVESDKWVFPEAARMAYGTNMGAATLPDALTAQKAQANHGLTLLRASSHIQSDYGGGTMVVLRSGLRYARLLSGARIHRL